jgi:hypothetical protein
MSVVGFGYENRPEPPPKTLAERLQRMAMGDLPDGFCDCQKCQMARFIAYVALDSQPERGGVA